MKNAQNQFLPWKQLRIFQRYYVLQAVPHTVPRGASAPRLGVLWQMGANLWEPPPGWEWFVSPIDHGIPGSRHRSFQWSPRNITFTMTKLQTFSSFHNIYTWMWFHEADKCLKSHYQKHYYSASTYLRILVLGELFYVKHVMLSIDCNKNKGNLMLSVKNTILIAI